MKKNVKQLRIAYISEMRMPTEKAHGIQIMRTCESLSLAGAKVKLFYSNRKQSNHALKNLDPYKYFGVNNTFEMKSLFYIDVLSLENFIKPFLKPLMFLANLVFAFTTIISTKSWNPDIYYTRHWLSAFVLLFAGKSVVFELHRAGSYEFSKRALKAILLLSKIKKRFFITCISNELKNTLIDIGVSENKIEVLPDALPTYKLKNNYSENKIFEFEVLYTGHLYEGRGVDIFIQSSKLLPDINFTIVGGNEKDRKHLIKKLNPKKNVKFVNHLSPSKIQKIQSNAKILVLPQTDIHGQSPLKLFEYIAAKRPIIASDLTPIKEILDHKKTALLFKSGDYHQLANRISELVLNPELRNFLSKNASHKYKDWTWEKRSQKIIKIIANKMKKN